MVVFSKTFAKGGRSHNGPGRPNAAQRRANKGYLLVLWGDGEACPCSYCGISLCFATVEADRVIAGANGGSYRRENIIPPGGAGNARRADKSLWCFAPLLARRLVRKGYVVSTKPAA